MKRSFYGLLGFAVLAINFLVAMPVSAISMNKANELCASWGAGTFQYHGSAGGYCSGNVPPQYSGACGNYGGQYNGTTCNWSSVDTSNSGNGGGSNGGGSNGGGSNSGGANGGSNSGGTNGGGSTPAIISGAASSTPNECGGAKTSLIKCNSSSDGAAIFDVLGIALNVVTYGVGAAAILGVIITGYQYMSARDNAVQVAKAKNRLLQVVIGLAIWVLFWGVLQFLLPGGLLANGS